MIKKFLIGFLAGLISGLFTAGGGLIIVPALLYTLDVEPKKARATSLFCVLPMVCVTSIFYGQNNFINWNIGIRCGMLGSKFLNRFSDKYLKIAFAAFLVYAGMNMIIK